MRLPFLRRPSRSSIRLSLLWCALLLGVSAVGCSGGSAGGIPNTVTPPPPPADIFELTPRFGGAGDVITFRATNIDSDPANLRVSFSDQSLGFTLDGLILSVTDGGSQAGLGTIWEVEVMVPGGVRSGSVSLFSNGFAFGGFAFTAAPEVIGVVVGQQGDLGAVSTDALGNVFPGTFDLYGHNLLPNVNQVSVEFSGGNFDAPNLTFNPPAGAGYVLPAGTEMLQVGLPGSLFSAACDTEPLGVTAFAPMLPTTTLLESARITVPLGQTNSGVANPTAAEAPGYFSGAIVPVGIRRGDVAVDYGVFMTPSSSTYAVVVEYQDPIDATGQTWLPCTPAPGSPMGDLLPGSREQSPGRGLIGVGSGHRFIWDTLADLPVGAPVVTRLRLSLADETPAAPCATGVWETPKIVVNNDAPDFGAIIEEFETAAILDPAGGNAVLLPGVLSAPANGGTQVPSWGTGTVDLVLAAGTETVIDTSLRSILDVTIPGSPVDLLPSAQNPGFAFSEFHLRTFTVEPGALVSVTGDRALVIRCSGDGLPSTTSLLLAADISLDGGAGGTATATARGAGGAASSGGGAGGDGGFIEVFQSDVTLLEDALPGERGGGAGGSTTYAGPGGTNSLPHAGSGGGGGGRAAGSPGTDPSNPFTIPVAPAGAGGTARGDAALTLPVGGGGGGGGGACAIRVQTAPSLTPKPGGGGGGGGGALEIVVRGRAELGAALTARGGAGGVGSGGTQSAAGGGGGGGTIAIRATGDIELLDTAALSVVGGTGGAAPGANVPRGGDGAAGTVRFEFGGSLLLPAVVPPELDLTHATSGPFTTSGMLLSRARTRPYRLTSFDGLTVGAPAVFSAATIFDAVGVQPNQTHVVALFEGAAADPNQPLEPGEFNGLVSDPALLDGAEFIRVWWFLYSSPGSLYAVDRLEVPFDQ